jgi:hypothetical protein
VLRDHGPPPLESNVSEEARLLHGEHVRGFEVQVNLILAEATDIAPADPDDDRGISGVRAYADSRTRAGCRPVGA